MSASSSHADVWGRYRAARATLLDTPAERFAALSADGDDERRLVEDPTVTTVDEFVASSEALREELRRHLDVPAEDQRQLAELQLQSAAVLDVDTANALIRAAAEEGAAPTRTLAPATRLSSGDVDELEAILSISPGEGLRALTASGDHGAAAARPSRPEGCGQTCARRHPHRHVHVDGGPGRRPARRPRIGSAWRRRRVGEGPRRVRRRHLCGHRLAAQARREDRRRRRQEGARGLRFRRRPRARDRLPAGSRTHG